MPWVFLASLLLLLPTTGWFRLLDADELTHARVALEAATQGHWWPLTLGGVPWPEKPPLLLWLSGLSLKAFGPGEMAVRLWPVLGACLALALAWRLLRRHGLAPWLALLGVLALGFSRDLLYHARFLSMDGWLLAAGLGAALALEEGRAWRAGAWLALAAAVKSWFVLGWLLPLLIGAVLLAPPKQRRREAAALALPPLAVLAVWLGLSAWAYGPGFAGREWQHDLWGRITGAGHPASAEPFSFYLGWARLFFPLGLASGAALVGAWAASPRNLWRQRPWAWALLLLWGLGLLLVRVTVFHYFLPWGVVAVLLWLPLLNQSALSAGLVWGSLLGLLVHFGPQNGVTHGPVLLLLLLTAGAGFYSQRAAAGRASAAWLGLALVLPAGLSYWWAPPDPNGPLVAALAAAPDQAQPLKVLGHSTQAPQYYFGKDAEYFDPKNDPPKGSYLRASDGQWIKY